MLQYLCPNCGGQMVYTSQQNALICDSCGSTFSADQIRTPNSHETCVSCGSSFEDIPRNVYSGFCESCDSAFVNESLLSAETPPDYMAPFEIDEKDAENLFIEWLSKRRWIPNQLKRDIKISARNKFLMPFYCYDYSGSGDMIFDCVKRRNKEKDGKNEIVSDHYDVVVKGNVTIKQYPVDAMNELTDKIVDCLAPFNNDTAVEFYPSQFTGMNSKQQDYTAEEMEDRAFNAAAKYSENFLRRKVLIA